MNAILKEVVGSTTGTDVEFIELIGTPGASLAGLSLIIVESDAGGSFGTIDQRLDFGAGDAIGENGFFLIGNASVLSVYSVSPNVEVPNNFIENSSYTIAIVETAGLGAQGSVVTGTETIVDGLFFDDGDGDTSPLPDLVTIPAGAFGLEAGAVRLVGPEVDATAEDYAIADFFNEANTPTAGTGDASGGGGPVEVKIHAVQGSGSATPIAGAAVVVEGVVTRAFLGEDELGGFYIQEEDSDADGDAATSEGIFVFAPGLQPGDVVAGQIISVTGTVTEFSTETQIVLSDYDVINAGDNSALVTAADILAVDADSREALEGMLVSMDEVTVTETFYLARDNQFIVSDGGLLEQYSQSIEPGTANAADFAAWKEINANRSVWIDDGSDRFDEQNPAQITVPDGNDGILGPEDTFTMGDTLTNLTGVVGVDFNSFNEGGLVVRGATGGYEDTAVAQPTPPDVGGDLQVASLNVLNFFTTLDLPDVETGTGGNPRGADFQNEFDRQLEKLVEHILTLDVDIIGLQELENSSTDSAIATLVDALNAELDGDPWDFVPTGLTGNPAQGDLQPISTGIIYRADVVEQVGDTAILDTAAFTDPNDTGEIRNRPAVTASFEVLEGNGAGEVVTVSSVHLKSKGSSGLSAGDESNPDSAQGDGQGFWNDTRALAAEELARWLDTNPTGVDAGNTLIAGDLNSYAGEDPIKALLDAGYINTLATQAGTSAYSYTFAGEWGTLDYVMGKGTLFDGALGDFEAGVWNANSPFPTVYNYDQSFEPTPPGSQDLFDPTNPFRASDHDPVLVGLDWNTALPDVAVIDAGERAVIDLLANDADGFLITAINGTEFKGNRAIPVKGEDGTTALVRLVDGGKAVEIQDIGKATEIRFDYTISNGEEEFTATATAKVAEFTLELLHAADQEGGARSVIDAPNFSAVLNALRAQDADGDGNAEDNTITLSSGDVFIPGLFFDASAAVFGSAGIADIQIQNELGFQAVALGNHEFDLGTGTLAGLIDGSATGDFSALVGSSLEGLDFEGAMFPYLSANLDFSTDENLGLLAVAGGQAPQSGVVTSSTVIETGGELIGVVGATTPTLDRIASPDGVGISPEWADTIPTPEELDALAAVIQAEVDAVLAANDGMNKVILLSHMQQISIEFELAERLSGVDIVVAGGSNTRLFDDNDVPRAGDSDQGQYPTFIDNADGGVTAVVNTDGSYKYVGRLVIDFDAEGRIIPESYDPEVSGAYATDEAGVAALGAEGLVDPEVQAIADAIQDQILATEGNVLGVADVFLNGNRSGDIDDPADPDGVRTQETNLGNLTADANLWYINEYFDGTGTVFEDVEFTVSIKNGGGIRTSIGETVVPAGGSEFIRSVNEEIVDGDGNIVKPEGGISQNDIQTTLAFNNDLSIGLMSGAEIVEALEFGVSALPEVNGRFIQISGVQFSFDETGIQDAAIVDESGSVVAVLMNDGVLDATSASQEFGVVTLNFLAGGGDGYAFPDWFDFVDLSGEAAETFVNGGATFAPDFTEQDALAEFLLTFHAPEAGTPYAAADTGRDEDTRIQNLDFQSGDELAMLVDDFQFV